MPGLAPGLALAATKVGTTQDVAGGDARPRQAFPLCAGRWIAGGSRPQRVALQITNSLSGCLQVHAGHPVAMDLSGLKPGQELLATRGFEFAEQPAPGHIDQKPKEAQVCF